MKKKIAFLLLDIASFALDSAGLRFLYSVGKRKKNKDVTYFEIIKVKKEIRYKRKWYEK